MNNLYTQFNYQTLFESTGTGIAVVNADGTISLANKKLQELLRTDLVNIIGHSFLEWIYEEDKPMMQQYHQNRLNGVKNLPSNYEFRIVISEEKINWMLVNLVFLPESKQTLTSLIDITTLKETQLTLQKINTTTKAILAAIPELMFELDAQGNYLNIWAHENKELIAQKDELIGKNIFNVMPKDAAQEVLNTLHDAKKNSQAFGRQIHLQTQKGKMWFELSASVKQNVNEKETFILLSRNITDRKELELKLLHLSNYDCLTNLYNRRMLIEQLEKEIHRATRYKLPLSVCMLDVDYFKTINDTYGHDIGDKVLMQMSNLLLETLRETDYSGRYGGEEFIIVLPETSTQHATELAQRLREKIENFAVTSNEKKEFHFTVSIGIASLNKTSQNAHELIKVADTMMYKAKDSGRNRVVAFEEAQH